MFFFMTHKEDQNKMSDLCRRIVLAAAHLSERRAVALDRFRTDGGAAAVLEAPHHSKNGEFYSISRAKGNKEDNATQNICGFLMRHRAVAPRGRIYAHLPTDFTVYT